MNIQVTELFEDPRFADSEAEKPNISQTERNISLVAGSFILWKSIKNIFSHPMLAVHGAAIGGLLIYRGTTGVCPLYKKLGKDTSENPSVFEEIIL